MTLREFANLFRMNTVQLSNISGYSREWLQTLVVKERSNKKINRNRFKAFVCHLQVLSDNQYNNDIANAKIDKKIREKAITKLCQKWR